jgi:hypothetical protein
LWRYGDGLFFEVPPLLSDALLTTLHPLLENVLQSVDHLEIFASELPFRGWKSQEISWGEIRIEFCVRLGKVDRWNPIRTASIQTIHRFINSEKLNSESEQAMSPNP